MATVQRIVDIAMLVPLGPQLTVELECRFSRHRVHAEADPPAYLCQHGDRMRGAVPHGVDGISTTRPHAMPDLETCTIMDVGLETTDVAGCCK